MPRANLNSVMRYVRRAVGVPSAPGSTDAQLLQSYCGQRDEAAFTELVHRHGGLVRSVCRRVLHHDQDAEDAFQATFLVLGSRAHSIRKTLTIASWLHGVAYRVAMNAKRARRQPLADSTAAAGRPQDEPATVAALREAQAIVDEELGRLSEKYRAPFVLCCLEGKTRAEAAAELGLLEGTVSSRIARARQELQQRLTRRGVVLSVTLCAIDLTLSAAPAIGPALADRTAKAAVSFAAGLAGTSDLATAPAVALAKGVLFAMSATSKLKIATVLVLTFGFLTATGAIARQVLGPAAGEVQAQQDPATIPPQLPAVGKTNDPSAGEDFTARILKISRGHVTFRKQESFPQGSSIPTLPVAEDGKILEGKVGRQPETIEAGPAIAGGLENERLRLGLRAGLLARILTDAKGQSIKEIRFVIPDNMPSDKPAQLIALTGPHGETDSDPLPAHAIARFGSLRFRHNVISGTPRIDAAPLIAMSTDGKRMASARSNFVQVWDTETGQRLAGWPFQEGPQARVSPETDGFGMSGDQPLTFSPDGKHLAMYWDSSKLRILAIDTGKVVKEIKVGEAPEGARPWRFRGMGAQQGQRPRTWTPYVSYLPDAKHIIIEDAEGPRVRLWDLESGAAVRTFRGSGDNLSAVALSPDGLALATGEQDGTVKIWDVGTGKERFKVKAKNDRLGAITFSPDGKLIAVADHWRGTGRGGNVYLWDVTTGKLLHTLAPPAPEDTEDADRRYGFFKDERGEWRLSPAYGLSFSPDGQQLTSSHVSWAVLWNPTSGKEIRRVRLEEAESEEARPARFLPRSETLFVAGRNVFHYFDASTGLPIHHYEGHLTGISSIAYAPDGKQIATAAAGFGSGGILVWDVRSRQVKLKTDGKSFGWRSNLAYSADGNSLAAARGDTVFVWDNRTGMLRLMLPGQESALFNSYLAVSKDGSRLAQGTGQCWITLYHLPSGKELEFLRLGDKQLMEMAFSPDLRLVAEISMKSGSGVRSPPNPIRLWDVEEGKEWRSISRGRESRDSLTFSPDGRTLLDVPIQGQAVLWELATGKSRFEIPVRTAGFGGIPHPVAAAFSPDGRQIAIAEQDNLVRGSKPRADESNPSFAIRIVDLVTGQSSVPLTGHQGPINALAFSPDGKLLASASDDTTALLWDLNGLFPPDKETTLIPDDRKSAWDDLKGEAKRAYWSMWRLAKDPGGIELLRKELQPAKAPADPVLVSRLVADLSTGDSAIRKRAGAQLSDQGPAVIPALIRLFESNPPPDVRASIKVLMDEFEGSQLRGFRAIEVLEKMNTPAARELLQKLAGGAADAPLTLEARRPLAGIIALGKASTVPVEPPKVKIVQPATMGPRRAPNSAVIKEEQGAAKAIEKLGGTFMTDPGGSGHIVMVVLSGTKTTDTDLKELKELKNLEGLSIAGTNVTDAGLKELTDFKNLNTLGLRQTKVTADGVKKLQEALPQCQIMRGGPGN